MRRQYIDDKGHTLKPGVLLRMYLTGSPSDTERTWEWHSHSQPKRSDLDFLHCSDVMQHGSAFHVNMMLNHVMQHGAKFSCEYDAEPCCVDSVSTHPCAQIRPTWIIWICFAIFLTGKYIGRYKAVKTRTEKKKYILYCQNVKNVSGRQAPPNHVHNFYGHD